MKSAIVSNKGQREINQDFVLTQPINDNSYLYLIADGMGGYEHGDTAARIIAENILTYLSTVKDFKRTEVQMAVNKANLAIKQYKNIYSSKMGATVGGVIVSNNKAFCFWVGDVKILLFRDNNIQFETQCHTLMNKVISSGSITEIKSAIRYKHIVTRAVYGEIAKSQVDIHDLGVLLKDDLVIICSDGVHDLLDSLQIQQMISVNATIEGALQEIEQRLLIDAKDNFSFIAIQNGKQE